MMTGTGFYITHWAYMAPFDGDPNTLPPLVLEPELLSPEWAWMKGTQWALECAELFGAGLQGHLLIDDYVNGYFWGSGTGPAGSSAENFTPIGSATPEGNILFNVLGNGTPINLTGQITSTATNGAMALRSYEDRDNFTIGAAQIIPEPSGPGMLGMLLVGASIRKRRREARQ